MIDKIKMNELSIDYYSNSQQVVINKINEMVEAMNQMRNDIDELMSVWKVTNDEYFSNW